MYCSNSFLRFLSCSAARPSYFLSSFYRTLLRSCALCLSIALSVLSSFSLSVLCFFACVALWGSCDCAVFVLLWARRLSWFLRSSLCLCGPWCFPCCLPSFVVVPVSVLPASPAPRLVLYLCSGPACTPVHWCLPLGIWLQL